MPTQFGRYTLEGELGRGASGTVFLALDPALQRRVALKVLEMPPAIQDGERAQMLERFMREARAAASINHPRIPQIHDVGTVSGQPYIVMEYCEGQTLDARLKAQGPVEAQRAIGIVVQVLEALHAAHTRGICHRDVKPGNIMLMSGGGSVKLMDFGIAKVATDTTLTQTGSVLGTPAYMAPEQVLGRNVDARADVFAVGVLLHEMLTGRRPFDGTTVTEIIHGVAYEEPKVDPVLPLELQQVIRRALAKDPAQRYQSVADMAVAIRQRGGRPRTAMPGSALRPTPIPPPPATQQAALASPPATPTSSTTSEVTTPAPGSEVDANSRGSAAEQSDWVSQVVWLGMIILALIRGLPALQNWYNTQTRPPTIMPGVRIGSARVGGTFVEIRRAYGDPETVDNGVRSRSADIGLVPGRLWARWPRHGIAVMFDDVDRNGMLTQQDTCVYVNLFVRGGDRTPEGIGVGSTIRKVFAAYGPSKRWYQTDWDWYPERGLAFNRELSEPRVGCVRVFAPNTMPYRPVPYQPPSP